MLHNKKIYKSRNGEIMNKIYLLSGPDKRNGFDKEIGEHLKRDLKKRKKFVAISASPKKIKKNDIYIYGNNDSLGLINMFSKLGLNSLEVTLLDERIDSKNGIETIKKADVIHLMGGDPLEQIEYIQNNNYLEYIKKTDALIIGTSAGAMNLADDVYCPKYEKVNKAFFYRGMGITNITIEPHFDVNNEIQVKEIKKMSNEKRIIGLPNESSIIIDNEDILFVGNYYIYDNLNM